MALYDREGAIWRVEAAAHRGDLAGVQAALADCPDGPDGPDGAWEEQAVVEALKYAVRKARPDIARVLVAEMKRRECIFSRTMHEGILAMAVMHEDTLEQLLADGFSPHSGSWSPSLCAAVERGQRGAALRLLRAGAHAGHLGGADGNQRLVGWLQEELLEARAKAEALRVSARTVYFQENDGLQ